MNRSEMSDALVSVLDVWKEGVLIMDEVDVLLHPLKSELNFPIGSRDPIDLAGLRWELPIHLIEALFAVQTGTFADRAWPGTIAAEVAGEASHLGHAVLAELKAAVEEGYARHALQRTPHLVLLDTDFYHARLQRPFARWALLWLRKNFLGTVQVADDLLLEFMCAPERAAVQWKAALEAGLVPSSVQLLNLAAHWLRAVLPHVLSKIGRVSFGLLDPPALAAADPKTPFSRKVLAVPFVGKDVPSKSSEFAH